MAYIHSPIQEGTSSHGTLWWIPVIIGVSAILRFVLAGVYNIFFHPLRHIPGPKWSAASNLNHVRTLLRGLSVEEVHRLHQKYGPVVRLAPNEVSFSTADAWKSIYGFRTGQREGYEKDRHFFPPPVNGTPGIIDAYGPDHSRQRRVFSHAFSENALRQQLPLMMKYVDLLISRLHEHAVSGTKLDAVAWYNFTTFDIIAELTFCQSFHCLESSNYHPIVELMLANLKAWTFLNAQQRFPLLKYFIKHYVPQTTLERRKDLASFVVASVDKRLSMEVARSDFLTPTAGSEKLQGLSLPEIQTTAQMLLNAGSETTATTLSAATYFTLSNPHTWQRLVKEVRDTFANEEDITAEKVNSELPFLLAVFNETLRLYPPVPTGFGRIVPPGGDTIAGYYFPEGCGVYISQYAINHSPDYFVDPEKFLPERWLGNERFKQDNHNAFNPFSYGPRNCLGKNLAYMEMRMIMTKIVWNFDLELYDHTPGGWVHAQKVYTLWEKPPLWICLRPVKRA
ncbi:hypothetical protein CLAIMM_04668 [Cladophialophora immunda]|nr:hypothetical protein CLAIMM_04668 [Cladophialophora immunda]